MAVTGGSGGALLGFARSGVAELAEARVGLLAVAEIAAGLERALSAPDGRATGPPQFPQEPASRSE